MEAIIFGLAVAFGSIAFGFGLVGLVVERRKKRRPVRERMVECAECGQELPVSDAVIYTGRVLQDRDTYSVTIAEYHRACDPGSLTQP